jgi:hypothetical protein
MAAVAQGADPRRRRVRRLLLAGAALAGAVAVAVVLLTKPDGSGGCVRQLVPAYFAPGAPGGWDALLAGTPPGVATAIVNPANGPGTARDPRYAEVVSSARAKGIGVVGYVHTRFGARPAAEVAADVERWREWYGVEGIFLDETSSLPADVPYYRELAARIPGTVILNPGSVPDEAYAEIGDVLVTFEGPWEVYADATFPAWTRRLDARRFAHLVYGAGGTEPGAVERLGAERNAAHVYATDDSGANPWDTLPATHGTVARTLADCGIVVAPGPS